MAAADQRLEKAMRAVADAADGLGLAATRRLGAVALAALALPSEQQLPAVLHLAALPPPGEQQLSVAGPAGLEQRRLQWVAAAAAVELVSGQPLATVDQAEAVLHQLLLPLLAASSNSLAPGAAAAANPRQQEELLHAAAQLVASCGCWGAGLQLVRAAVDSPGQAAVPAQGAGGAGELAPDLRVRLAAAVVQQALQAASQQQRHQEPELGALLQHAATQTFAHALALLAAEPPARQRQRSKGGATAAAMGTARAAAAQLLLPAALHAAVQQRGSAAALAQLWEACK